MAYKFLDYTGLEYVINTIKNKFVQKVSGKALSTNDFTNTLKDKLDGVESGAQVNTVNQVNNKTGNVVLNSEDISFTSSVAGSTPTTIRKIIDDILEKDEEQDVASSQVANRVSALETNKADKTYTDTELDKKADKTTTYTKTETDTELNKKADQVTTYTKLEIDGKLEAIDSGVISVNEKTGVVTLDADDISDTSTDNKFVSATEKSTWNGKANVSYVDTELDKKADKTTTYTKTETDTELNKKADKTTTYTKLEIDGKLGEIDSGVISVNEKTGVVTLDADDISDTSTDNKFVSATEKSTWNGKANVSYVDTEVGKKVDKVTGKGLSTNDFTTTLKNKLDGIDSGAQTNVIETITRNGTNLTVIEKAVDINVPTKLSDLINDKTFKTETEIKSLIAEHGKLKKEIVLELPTIAAADENTMYLIRNEEDTGYEEWMIINGVWEILGDTAAVDFTGYIHENDISLITTAEIDVVFAAV